MRFTYDCSRHPDEAAAEAMQKQAEQLERIADALEEDS
jgi:hypothetical protein